MTAADPTLIVQTAIYEALTSSTDLMDLVSGVYDYVDEAAPYPYIVIGEAVDTPDNRHRGFGWQTVVTLHVWTKYRGHTQGLRIAERVTALLDHQPLAVEGLDHIATHYEFGQTLTDPEPPGDIRHVVRRYRVITEQP